MSFIIGTETEFILVVEPSMHKIFHHIRKRALADVLQGSKDGLSLAVTPCLTVYHCD